jgi:Ca2+-binding RTX toxin-like protein
MARISGTSSDDSFICGTDKNDTIDGGTGWDNIYGLGGNDYIFGGRDCDWIDGGAGRDKLYGYAEADWFVFSDVSHSTNTKNGRDLIGDFEASDFIDLSAIHAVSVTITSFSSDKHRVTADVNGDGVADFGIDVIGTAPTDAQIIL